MRRLRLTVVIAALTCPAVLAGPPATASADQVIVMGDSVAFGCCVADPAQRWGTIFAQRLDADLHNLGINGWRSDQVISEPHFWEDSGRTQPQLAEAVSLLDEAPPGDVRAVTFDIGPNNLIQLNNPPPPDGNGQPCLTSPSDACLGLVQAEVQEVKADIDTVLDTLEGHMDPDTAMIVMTYYNPLDHHPTLGPPIEQAVQLLNGVIEQEIAEHGTRQVDAHPYFDDRTTVLVDGGIHPSVAGQVVLADLFTNQVPPDTDGDGLSDEMEEVLESNPGPGTGSQDSDGDGCTDFQEFGPSAPQGGRRSPATLTGYWDFFDTPIPAPSNSYDRVVTIGDIGGVVGHFGTDDDANDDGTLDDVNRNTPPRSMAPQTGLYHPAFDRSGVALGADTWDLGAPDGNVSVGDIGSAVAQFGHSCM